MAARESALINWSEYLALRAISGFMQCFDVDQNLATAGALGSLLNRISRRHRRRARRHIAASFPEWDRSRVAEIAERSMRHMIQLFMVESAMIPRLVTSTSWPRYLRIGDLGPAMNQLIQNKPALFITGHCGNWELLGYSMAVMGYPMYALARPLDNPLLNKWVMGIREARGMRVLTKFGAAPVLQQIMRSGGNIAFIADQNAGDQGLFVPFFGRLASSYKSIGLLAMRYRVPIIAAVAWRRSERFSYELSCVDYIDPTDWEDQPDPLYYITARYNRAIELMIRRAPEQYLWVHRRWKSRPRHERLGRPMPTRLIEKLRSLPWLTEADIERLRDEPKRTAAIASQH